MDKWLIETEELAHILSQNLSENRVILDCSWYLPDAGKHAIDDFRDGHIPSARFVDLGAISDPDSPYVNMLPSPELFAHEMGKLGISNDTEVILYDAGYVSARVWWMLRTFGHDRVRILNGGWRKWKNEGKPVETGDFALVQSCEFTATVQQDRIVSLADMKQIVNQGSVVIVDARTAARFDGHEGSGYPGVASGYMPGAINTPWALFFEPAPSHRFISAEKALDVFSSRGVDVSNDIITTCGSGVTASILGFMLEALGQSKWRLYDGSWHEWGQQPDTPKLIKPL